MKRLGGLILVILMMGLGSLDVSAQSLADVAKKEKSRRQKTASSSKVITDRDLAQSYGGLRETTTASAADDQEGAEQDGEEDNNSDEQDETKTRDYWQKRVTGVSERIATIEQRLSSSEFDWQGGIRSGADPRGSNSLQQRQDLEQELAGAQAELAAIQDEARRQNIPAGWVR